MAKLDGKIAIVTGSAGGIGESCARTLATAGAHVAIADVNHAGAETIAAAIVAEGGRAFAVPLDLTEESSISALYATVLARCGQIDVLLNNAAETSPAILGADMAIGYMAADVWDRAFAVNTRGTMLMIKHAIEPMRASGGGSIINISSSAAVTGSLTNPAYAASKAAVNCLTLYVATQYGKHGIRCNAVSPGMIQTVKSRAMLTQDQLDGIERHNLTPSLGYPEDIAAAVLWLASGDARFVTAQVIAIDGGITAHMPQVAELRSDFDANQKLV